MRLSILTQYGHSLNLFCVNMIFKVFVSNMKHYLKIIIFLFLIFFFGSFDIAFGQNFNDPTIVPFEETLEATVTNILENSETKLPDGELQIYQKLELLVNNGPLGGEKIIVESGNFALVGSQRYKNGDRLIIMHNKDFEGNDVFFVSDYVAVKKLCLGFFKHQFIS